jgi:flagellar biosynthetic protein FlhB
MSDTSDKTEEPTARKLEKTREEGQFARSQELSVAILTIAVAILLFIIGGTIASNLLEIFEKSFI